MTKHRSGAFPYQDKNGSSSGGLNKREYIAAIAMQGLLASGSKSSESIALQAVECADALIKALNEVPIPEDEDGSSKTRKISASN